MNVEAMVVPLIVEMQLKPKLIKPTPLLGQLPPNIKIVIKKFQKPVKPIMCLKHLPREEVQFNLRKLEDYALGAAQPKRAAKPTSKFQNEPKPSSKKQNGPSVEPSPSEIGVSDSSMEAENGH